MERCSPGSFNKFFPTILLNTNWWPICSDIVTAATGTINNRMSKESSTHSEDRAKQYPGLRATLLQQQESYRRFRLAMHTSIQPQCLPRWGSIRTTSAKHCEQNCGKERHPGHGKINHARFFRDGMIHRHPHRRAR